MTLARAERQALDRARDQLNSGDAESARQTLRQLEQTLRDHPELLQAAWLMAECYRLEGQIAAHGANPTAAPSPDEALAWDLSGGHSRRRAGYRVRRSPRATKAADTVTVTLAVHGARRYEVLWDGVSATDRIASAAGEHHVVIRRGGRSAWSGWISVLASGTVDVWVPDAEPCSRKIWPACRSEREKRAGGAERREVRRPGPLLRRAWIRGTLQMARCSGEKLPRPRPRRTKPSQRRARAASRRKRVPCRRGRAWTIAGAGVAAATTFVLWGKRSFRSGESPWWQVVW